MNVNRYYRYFIAELIICVSILMLFLGHCYVNNKMMTYVEKKAYDGSDRNE